MKIYLIYLACLFLLQTSLKYGNFCFLIYNLKQHPVNTDSCVKTFSVETDISWNNTCLIRQDPFYRHVYFVMDL